MLTLVAGSPVVLAAEYVARAFLTPMGEWQRRDWAMRGRRLPLDGFQMLRGPGEAELTDLLHVAARRTNRPEGIEHPLAALYCNIYYKSVPNALQYIAPQIHCNTKLPTLQYYIRQAIKD